MHIGLFSFGGVGLVCWKIEPESERERGWVEIIDTIILHVIDVWFVCVYVCVYMYVIYAIPFRVC